MTVNAKIEREVRQKEREIERERGRGRRMNEKGRNLLVDELSTGAKRDIVYGGTSPRAYSSCRRDRAVFIEGFIKLGIGGEGVNTRN